MAKTESMPLIVGLPGPHLGPRELAVLDAVQPVGVILFARNIEDPDQTRGLVSTLLELEPHPFVSIDLEGGVVNRLSGLWGELPTAAEVGAAGRRAALALGEAAGAACRNLGIHIDYAPVIDLDVPGGLIGMQGRCFGADPERVATLARLFARGLSAWGITGCAKHFPGLGPAPVDTHDQLPRLEEDAVSIDRGIGVFEELCTEIPLVMVAHVITPQLGDGERPGSLSPRVVDRAASLPGAPVVVSDDVEMDALEQWGDLPDRVELALRARNHGVLICKSFDRLEEITAHLNERCVSDSSLGTWLCEMAARMGTLRREVCQRAAAIPAPDDETVAQLWDQARSAAEA